jgi:hypothetical protein
MPEMGRKGIVAMTLALAFAGGAWYRVAGGDAPARGAADASRAAAARDQRGSKAGPAWLSDLPPQAGAQAAAVPLEPLAERLQRLGAGSDPRDAYRAYQLVRACSALRVGPPPGSSADVESPLNGIADPLAYCSAMTERMRTDAIALLERAARAGVDGALEALVEEGPFGDPSALVQRPDDPLVKDWKDRVNAMLGEQAKQGDWNSLYLSFTGFMFSNPAISADRQRALAYGIAMRDILVKGDGLTEDQAIPFNTPFLDMVKNGLTREQQDQAVVQAAAIVDAALRQRARTQRPGGRPAV